MKAANKELTIKNNEKSLELNPENKNAEKILKRLRSYKKYSSAYKKGSKINSADNEMCPSVSNYGNYIF